jgi:hypothetical protein
MQYRFDPDAKPKSRGRLPQLAKRNRRMFRESEAVALWKRIDPRNGRDLFATR